MGTSRDEELHRLFDGELSEADRARVEADLTPEDRERLAALDELNGLLAGALEAEAADVDLWPGISDRLSAQRSWWRRNPRRTYSLGIAAAVAAALLMVFRPTTRRPSNDAEVEMLDYAGTMATVIQLHDDPAEDSPTTTVIWTEEE